MANQTEKKKNKMNPIVWFLFAIVIPGAVALVLTVIILSVAGVDVLDWAKNAGNKIPVVSSMIATDEEEAEARKEEKLQGKIASKDEEIQQLTQDVTNLEGTVENLEQEIIKLENKRNDQDTSTDEEEDNEDDTLKKVSSSFKDMDSQQAALILNKLEKNLAVSILKELSNDVRGNVFEKMDPESAASLMKLFMNSES